MKLRRAARTGPGSGSTVRAVQAGSGGVEAMTRWLQFGRSAAVALVLAAACAAPRPASAQLQALGIPSLGPGVPGLGPGYALGGFGLGGPFGLGNGALGRP